MWGEIPNILPEPNNSIDLSSVIEQSRQKDCLSMYHIPSSMNETREIMIPHMDPRMLLAAELHQCIGTMTNFVEEAELAVKYNLVMQSEMPTVITPEIPDTTPTVVARRPIPFLDKKYSVFTMGFDKKPPNLNESTRRHIETKCIATMLSHIGFLSANSSVIEVLTDVFENFMKTICNELRCTHDNHLSGEGIGFADIVEQVLTQFGLGGVRGVCDYYEKRVNKYEGVLKARYQNVATHYKTLLAPVIMQVESKIERMDELDSEDVPEVHFTAKDGEEGYLQPFLESGFQMLTSLEKEQL